jgi:hypothetical protein
VYAGTCTWHHCTWHHCNWNHCNWNHKEPCMRRLAASLFFLIAGAFTFAQAPSNKPLVLKTSPTKEKAADSVVLYANRPDNTGCPVGFSASRQGIGHAMSAADARQASPAQGLHLMLDRLTQPAIDSIEITVYGVSSKARVLPAGPPPGDISKTFELRRSAGSNSLSDADVWLHNAGSLSHVDLISIHYADGTTWHTTENLKCRAVPSNFLLIGAK